MISTKITMNTLDREIRSAKKQIRAAHKGRRVYFDEPSIDAASYGVRLNVNFRIADDNGGFVTVCGSPEHSWTVAL